MTILNDLLTVHEHLLSVRKELISNLDNGSRLVLALAEVIMLDYPSEPATPLSEKDEKIFDQLRLIMKQQTDFTLVMRELLEKVSFSLTAVAEHIAFNEVDHPQIPREEMN